MAFVPRRHRVGYVKISSAYFVSLRASFLLIISSVEHRSFSVPSLSLTDQDLAANNLLGAARRPRQACFRSAHGRGRIPGGLFEGWRSPHERGSKGQYGSKEARQMHVPIRLPAKNL